MKTKPVTVNVSSELYQKLIELQEQKRETEGKKTALSEILVNLAYEGIQTIENTQNEADNTQNLGQNTQENFQNTQNKAFFKSSLSKKQDNFSKIMRKKLKYLNELEDRLREKDGILEDQRTEFYTMRDEYLYKLESRTIQHNLETERVQPGSSNLYRELSDPVWHPDKAFLDDNFEMLNAAIETLRNDMTRHETMEREMHGRTLEMLKINAENIRHDIKNPPKPPINIWTYLPWIAMVLIPYLMERLKSKKDKDLLQNLQNNLSELLKSQKKEKRE